MQNEGWLCPRCKKINAPWSPQCWCKEGQLTATIYGHLANEKDEGDAENN